MCAFCLDVIGSVCLCMWPRECVRIFLPNVYISASVFEFVWVGVDVCVCLSVSVSLYVCLSVEKFISGYVCQSDSMCVCLSVCVIVFVWFHYV